MGAAKYLLKTAMPNTISTIAITAISMALAVGPCVDPESVAELSVLLPVLSTASTASTAPSVTGTNLVVVLCGLVVVVVVVVVRHPPTPAAEHPSEPHAASHGYITPI